MALKANLKDKVFNMAYGIGAAVILLGVLFKLIHWGPANIMLTAGLVTEAIIFLISAFDFPVGNYEWEKVYPELVGKDAISNVQNTIAPAVAESNVSLSQKLDEMLKDARVDAELVTGLKHSFEKLGHSVDALNQSTEDAKNVSEQLNTLSGNLTSLNNVYGGMLSAMGNSKK